MIGKCDDIVKYADKKNNNIRIIKNAKFISKTKRRIIINANVGYFTKELFQKDSDL